jgi:hypothetical protein
LVQVSPKFVYENNSPYNQAIFVGRNRSAGMKHFGNLKKGLELKPRKTEKKNYISSS